MFLRDEDVDIMRRERGRERRIKTGIGERGREWRRENKGVEEG